MTLLNTSLARRLVVSSVLLLTTALALTGTLATINAGRHAEDLVNRWLTDKVRSVADSIDAFDTTSREMAERSYTAFRSQLPGPFTLDAAGGLRHAGQPLDGRFDVVDAFGRHSGGGVATIFVRRGEEFVRIATNVKKQDGTRAVGTQLARSSPAYPRMVAGQKYVGRTVLFGKPYMTVYEPVKDETGTVIGLLFVGFDVTSFQTLLEGVVAGSRFFETGGTYVVDPRASDAEAVFVAHPTFGGRKVLEALPEAGPFLARLRAAQDVNDPQAMALLQPGRPQPWAVKRASSTTGWWVVAEVSHGEALADHRDNTQLLWLLLAGCAAVLAAGLMLLVRREVSRPLAALTAAVDTLAAGDLRQPFVARRPDEVGRLVRCMEAMRLRFVDIIAQLREASDQVRTASTEIAAGHQDLSARTEQAANSLQQTASSVEQLSATVRQSAASAEEANALAHTSAELVRKGGTVMAQVVSTMDGMSASSRRIADIIGVIDGIAFQTNILALNAAVEAARAGEQGRGFAVVASEVRGLAQRSGDAAREIKQLIGESVGQVATCSGQVRDAGATMDGIVQSVERVTTMIRDITTAAGAQSSGLGVVTQAMAQLDVATQQNAALVEQGAAAAHSLQAQSAALSTVVRTFRTEHVPA